MEMTTDMLAPELIFPSAAPAEINALALLSIKPEEYVAQVFAPFRTKLATLKAEADTIHFIDDRMFDAPHRHVDIGTTEGMAIAVKYRAALRREIRLDAEDARAARKAPILQIGKLLDSNYKAIVEEAAPYEEKFDGAIKAEEKRKADVRVAKERAEAERIGGIKTTIEAIRTWPARNLGKSAAELRELLEQAAARVITKDEFAEFTEEAQAALDASGGELVVMFTAAQEREHAAAAAESARLAEIQRLAAEQAAADQRRADEAAELARQRADQERAAAELVATAKRLADQQAAIEKAAQQQAAQAAENARAHAAALAEIAEQQAAADARDAAARQALEDTAKAAECYDEAHAENAQRDELTEVARLQAAADQHLADAREPLAMPVSTAPAGLLDAADDDELDPSDDEIIAMGAECGLQLAAWVERLRLFVATHAGAAAEAA